jgi:cell division transport system permease protein
MKILKQSFFDIFRNGISSVMFISVVSVTIFIVYTFSSVLFNLHSIQNKWSKQASIMLFPVENEDLELLRIIDSVKRLKGVVSVELLDQTSVLDILKQRFPGQDVNISSIYIPKLIELKADIRDVEEIASKIKRFDNIEDVVVNSAWFENLSDLISAINYIVIAVAFLILILAFILLSYVGRISSLQRRPEIELMKLCGATDWYIRKPYLVSGLFLGLLGGGLGLLLYLLIDAFMKSVAQYFIGDWLILPIPYIASLSLLAVVLGALGNFFALPQGVEYE